MSRTNLEQEFNKHIKNWIDNHNEIKRILTITDEERKIMWMAYLWGVFEAQRHMQRAAQEIY